MQDPRAGWHPDPLGRYELRWFDGTQWTADVAVSGARYVDPLGVTAAAPRRGLAVASLVVALVSLSIAWLPLLFVVSIAGAVVALGLGAGARRRSAAGESARRLAAGGMVVALAALGLSIVGGWLTVRLADDLADLTTVPVAGAHAAAIDECVSDGDLLVAKGSITNNDTEPHDYDITVLIAGAAGDELVRETVRVSDVDPGERATFAVTDTAEHTDPVSCDIVDVTGPVLFPT
ncbi:MAG: DUF2510 domain-containing protein [Ilumatobacteraceae bacterium]